MPLLEKNDYSNSTAARAAEAAREAQQARAEFAKAQQERAALLNSNPDNGLKAPVRRTSSAASKGNPRYQNGGIKTDSNFKFVAPVANQFGPEDDNPAPSPFKPKE